MVENLVWAYAVLVTVVAAVCFGVRWYLLRGPDRPDATVLDGEQVGFITGGPKRSAAAALARRRLSGEVGTPGDAEARSAAAEVRRGLLADGWLVPDRRRDGVGFCGMALGYVAAPGFIATVLFLAEERPVGGWVALTAAAVVLALVAGSRSNRYRSVRRELRRLRDASAHLRQAERPALVTYGPGAAALAVGLFGPTVMASVDPQFAYVIGGLDVGEPDSGAGTGSGCGGCGCGGCGCGG